MHIRLPLILAAALSLSACGNKADLLQPSQVPPEDRGRYIFKGSIPTREQLDAQDEADWDDADEDDGADDAPEPVPATPVPLIRDVPAATGTP
ncbi:hypothetical protein ACF3M1_02155 [Luteimonas sp. WGS1318]|uniref:hypothetical protein n=1 Tax=Luteimonas sp. WGS1318 TaxID=3366815 RepID=UPI00372D4E90